jgi:hydroxymethylglutaryl-CoA reductase (NADPH)
MRRKERQARKPAMTSTPGAAARIIEAIRRSFDADAVADRQRPDTETPRAPSIRPARRPDLSAADSYWRTLRDRGLADAHGQAQVLDDKARADQPLYRRNIENYLGTVKVPLGLIGPLRVNGVFAKGDFYVPLATTEAALVASYGRGARLITAAGGCATAMVAEAVQRSPGFAFRSIAEAGAFVAWVGASFERLKAAADSTTSHGRLVEIAPHMEADHVYLVLSFTTGDAAGQNMATFAADAVCAAILAECPVKPVHWFLEANFSGDKKACAQSFMSVRGRKATAAVELAADDIRRCLHTDAARMQDYWRMSALGGVMSGAIGVQGHYANGLAAFYLATGQDAACVAESAVGVTRMEMRDGGRLFASVTLPNIMVGAVGGGVHLPSQSAALNILGLQGEGRARALAEICAALCLAGELSIVGALCAGAFAAAHQRLARSTP